MLVLNNCRIVHEDMICDTVPRGATLPPIVNVGIAIHRVRRAVALTPGDVYM